MRFVKYLPFLLLAALVWLLAGCSNGPPGEVKAEGPPPPGTSTVGTKSVSPGGGQPGSTGKATSQSTAPTAQ